MRPRRWLILFVGIVAIGYFSGALESGYNWLQESFREFTGAEVWTEEDSPAG